jgi:hypothetical protein
MYNKKSFLGWREMWNPSAPNSDRQIWFSRSSSLCIDTSTISHCFYCLVKLQHPCNGHFVEHYTYYSTTCGRLKKSNRFIFWVKNLVLELVDNVGWNHPAYFSMVNRGNIYFFIPISMEFVCKDLCSYSVEMMQKQSWIFCLKEWFYLWGFLFSILIFLNIFTSQIILLFFFTLVCLCMCVCVCVCVCVWVCVSVCVCVYVCVCFNL